MSKNCCTFRLATENTRTRESLLSFQADEFGTLGNVGPLLVEDLLHDPVRRCLDDVLERKKKTGLRLRMIPRF